MNGPVADLTFVSFERCNQIRYLLSLNFYQANQVSLRSDYLHFWSFLVSSMYVGKFEKDLEANKMEVKCQFICNIKRVLQGKYGQLN